MKILKLTIHNIASIKDAVIDFTVSPLDTAALFLISGKTGAGKSTILDCISLALYDDTPRLRNTLAKDSVRDADSEGSIASNDTRQMLRKHSAEGFVELDFIGNNDVSYRASWSVSRARKKTSGKLQSAKRTLERLDTGHTLDKRKEIEAEISRSVNLDFNQFCRTVMLAQGEFSKFLNSNDADKAAILSKITGTEIYTVLGKRIYERYRNENNKFDQCRTALENLEMLSEEQRASKVTEIAALSSSVKALGESLTEYATILASLTNKQKCEAELERISTRRLQLSSDFGSFLSCIKRLDEAKIVMDNGLERLRDEVAGYSNRAAILTHPENLLSITDRIEDYRTGIKNNQHIIDEQTAYKETVLIPQLTRLTKDAQEITELLHKEQAIASEMLTQIESINLPGLRSEYDELLRRRVKFENLNIALGLYTKCREDIDNNKKALLDIEKERDALIRQVEELQTPALIAKVKLDTLVENHEKLFASSEKILSKIRSSLHPGDTCPVCQGKIIKPLPSDESVAAVIAESRKNLDEARKETERINKLMTELEANVKSKLEVIEKLKTKINDDASLQAADLKIRDICRTLSLDCDEIKDTVLKDIYSSGIKNIETRSISLKTAIDDGEALEKELRKKDLNIKAWQERTASINKAMSATQVKIAACDSQTETLSLHIVVSRNNIATLNSEIQELILDTPYHSTLEDLSGLKERVKSDAENYKRLKDSIREHEVNIDKLSATISTVKDTAGNIKEYFSDMEASAMSPDIKEIPSGNLLNFGQNLIGECKACEELSIAANKQLEQENKIIEYWVETHPDEPLDIIEITASYKALHEEIDAKNRTMGALDAELKHDDATRDNRKKLFEEFQQQEKRLDKWRKLNELFGDSEGKKFRKIAQSYILSELIRSANHYLSGFTDRYRLTIEPGTFIIMVEDAWNSFSPRPASTISGGESFMVSLSLALSLSDLNTEFSVDVLFIDEGFGSLSAEYLQSAVETLRTLHRKSGRRIGIISHVEELRERIPVQINVESAPNSSYSTVRISG